MGIAFLERNHPPCVADMRHAMLAGDFFSTPLSASVLDGDLFFLLFSVVVGVL
jgi:hypothetical protein